MLIRAKMRMVMAANFYDMVKRSGARLNITSISPGTGSNRPLKKQARPLQRMRVVEGMADLLPVKKTQPPATSSTKSDFFIGRNAISTKLKFRPWV
jgi:hypothetical protein